MECLERMVLIIEVPLMATPPHVPRVILFAVCSRANFQTNIHDESWEHQSDSAHDSHGLKRGSLP